MRKKKLRKVLLSVLVLIAFPVAFNIVGLFLQPRYSAEVRVLVDETTPATPIEQSQFQFISDIENAYRPRSTQTQLDIMTGSDVLLAAIRMAHDKMPDKVKMDDEHLAQIYDTLAKRLTVDNEMNSDILSLKVTQNDPAVAAEIANDIALAYIDYMKSLAAQAGSQEVQMLQATLDQEKRQLLQTDKQISDIKAKSQVLDVTTAEQAAAANRSTAEQKLADVQGQYDGAASSLKIAEAELKRIPVTISTGTQTQANPVLLNVQQSLATERLALADLESKYDDSFPMVKEQKLRVKNVESQIKDLKEKIEGSDSEGPNPVYQTQLNNVITLRTQVKAFAEQYASAKAEYDKASAQAGAIPAAERQLQGLIRNRTVAEQNYETLFQKLSAIQTEGLARKPEVQVVSPAYPPTTPSFPDPRLLTLAGIALGGFFAILILMPRPETPGDASKTLGVQDTPTLPSDAPDDSAPKLPKGKGKGKDLQPSLNEA